MGRLIEGPKLQRSPSVPIKYPRAGEAKPILPVSEMDGKKAARAAQILARAARSFSSAANMSGRITISSEGNPAAINVPFFWSARVSGTVKDRKSDEKGSRGSVRVDCGGGSVCTKQTIVLRWISKK